MASGGKRYESPKLIVHGDLRKLTKAGGVGRRDVPIGDDISTKDGPPRDGPPIS